MDVERSASLGAAPALRPAIAASSDRWKRLVAQLKSDLNLPLQVHPWDVLCEALRSPLRWEVSPDGASRLMAQAPVHKGIKRSLQDVVELPSQRARQDSTIAMSVPSTSNSAPSQEPSSMHPSRLSGVMPFVHSLPQPWSGEGSLPAQAMTPPSTDGHMMQQQLQVQQRTRHGNRQQLQVLQRQNQQWRQMKQGALAHCSPLSPQSAPVLSGADTHLAPLTPITSSHPAQLHSSSEFPATNAKQEQVPGQGLTALPQNEVHKSLRRRLHPAGLHQPAMQQDAAPVPVASTAQDPPISSSSRMQQQEATVTQPSQQAVSKQQPRQGNSTLQRAEARESQPSRLTDTQTAMQSASQSSTQLCLNTMSASTAAASDKPLSEDWRRDYHRWYLESCEELERRASADDASEDYCFVCKDGGDLIECDYGRGAFPETSHGSPCYKVYHLECVGLEKVPEDTAPWFCPRHRCKHANCEATMDSHRLHTCKSCPTTFCQLHCSATGAKTLAAPEQPEDNHCIRMKCDNCQALEDAQIAAARPGVLQDGHSHMLISKEARDEPLRAPLTSHAASKTPQATQAIGATRSRKHMPTASAPCVLGTVPTARPTSEAEAISILNARQVLLSMLGDIPSVPNSSVRSEAATGNNVDPFSRLQPLNFYGMDSWQHCLDSPPSQVAQLYSAAQQPLHEAREATGPVVIYSDVDQAVDSRNGLQGHPPDIVQLQSIASMETWQECLESLRHIDAHDALAVKHAVSKAIELAHSSNNSDIAVQLEFALSDQIFKPTSALWTKKLALRQLERTPPVKQTA